MPNYKFFQGVRITPKEVVFENAYEGKSFREKITFQNVSPKTVIIKTTYPSSNSFKVDRVYYGEKLSSGLILTVWVSYTFTHASTMFAQMTIYINETRTDLNFNVTPSRSEIYCVPRNLNFGKVNLGYAVHIQKLRLYNKGNRQTKYEFDVSSNTLGLSMNPRKGFIQGQDSAEIEVYLIGFEEGVYTKEIWVKCDQPFRFTLFVEVITPKLYICSPHDYTESFLPIMFPPIYGGCRITQTFDVFNYNMLETTFIIVPEYNFEIMAAHKVEELDPTYKNFSFSPIEGDLKPSESQSIEISFEPPIRKLLSDNINFVCFRLIRLECQTVDKVMSEHIKRKPFDHQSQYSSYDDSSSFTSEEKFGIDDRSSVNLTKMTPEAPSQTKMSFGAYIRICVYAIVKSMKVQVVPVNFTLSDMLINTEIVQFLNIRNKSKSLPIFYEYEKVGYIRVDPPKGYINTDDRVTVKVIFSPTAAGPIDNPIKLNFFYYSQSVNNKQVLTKVGSILIPVYVPVKLKSKKPKPKFNMGITPRITNEVGLMADNVRFNTRVRKPKMAIQQCYGVNPSKRLNKAKISFPNDRPQSLQPWRNKDVKCITIFAELARVVAPPDEYMLTEKQRIEKIKNNNYYLNFIRNREYRRADNNHEEVLEDYITNKKKLLQKIGDLTCPQYWKQIFSEYYQENFAPLKPIQIYFVKISPSKIYFPAIVVNSTVTYSISISNENIFPVHILINSFHRHSVILPNLPEEIIVQSSESIVITKTFSPINSGLFSTVINVYLNNCHLVPILLQAEVVRPTVSVDFTEIIFDEKNPSFVRAVPLRNKLNVPVVFTWHVPENCSYTVNPMTGTIPSSRYIHCELVYTPNFDSRNCVKLSVECEGGGAVYIHVNACYSKSSVEVLEHKIEMPHIPLNIPVQQKNVLRNQGMETVLFRIKNPTLCPGVTIEPEKGAIRGRSDQILTITILFEVFIKFDIKIEILFEYGSVNFVILGHVDFPTICCKPKDIIQFKRIPAESFQIIPFSIENKGDSEVNIAFPKSAYPEITVSGSHHENISLASNIEVKLEKGETVYLYMHFHPLDVCMNIFYLPMILNNKIGPAEKLDEHSMYGRHYIHPQSFSTAEDTNIEQIMYKNKLSVLTLSTVSTKHILRFSKTLLNFKYIPSFPNRSVTSLEFKVKNCVKEKVEFCFDIGNMAPNFEMSCKANTNVTHRDEDMMVFAINEEMEITIIVNFLPHRPGEFICNVPIYIKNVNDDEVFNYIKLNASYPEPTFVTPRWCFLEPVLINTKVIFDLILLSCYHLEDCTLVIDCDLDQLSFFIKPSVGDSEKPCRQDICIQLIFESSTPISACRKMTISCSCGAETFLIVGVCAADDIVSSYTNHCPKIPRQYIMTSRGFPYFPAESDDSDFANYMRKCVTVVERWVYEQALNQTYYYFIPEDMSGNYRPLKYKRKGTSQTLVLMQILINVGCNEIVIPCTEIPNDEISRVHSIHCNLKHILLFLHKQGAYIPHVRSRYLLTYSDYVMYITKIRGMKDKSLQNVKPKDLFLRRSTQCWLDLLISVFKTLVLSRISFKKARSKRKSSNISRESSSMLTLTLSLSPELSLLSWLDMIYLEEIDNLMLLDTKRSENFVIKPSPITNFTTDLSNGLVLIAVTIHFCPYLMPQLKDIYVDVDAPEKAYNNAVVLIEAWKSFNCSFTITPSEIVEPLALQMVFLVMYMYDAFTSMLPKEELVFSASLSLTDVKEIILRNPNSTDLHYDVRFLNNKNDCFRALTASTIKISPGKSFKLKIEYRAKMIETRNAILLLCGDTPGQLYCKSVVYSLTGMSNMLGEHDHVVINIDLYKALSLEFPVKSPYKVAATYECLCAKCPPEEVLPQFLVPVRKYLSVIRPRTIFTESYTLVTDENGEGTTKIKICCLSTKDFDATIVFQNPEVGDFFISIVIQPINFEQIEKHTLVVNLPSDWDSRECNCCKKSRLINPQRCARRVLMKIPCKNDQFWNIIIEAIMLCIPPSEKQVWNKVLENEMGPHILQWLMAGSKELQTVQHILDSNITYILENKDPRILLPETITIENVRSDNFIEVQMHVLGYVTEDKTIDFSLKSVDGSEYRWYAIQFIKDAREPTADESLINQIAAIRPMFHSII